MKNIKSSAFSRGMRPYEKNLRKVLKKVLDKTPAGFTLMEMSAVLAIIVIITLISIPFFSSYNQNQALENSAKQLMSDLKLAQQNTVTQQIKYSIKMAPDSGTYTLIKKGNPDLTISTQQLDSHVIVSQITGLTGNEAVFNPTGAVDYSGEVYLQHNTSETQIQVSIKPSGFVTWVKVTP